MKSFLLLSALLLQLTQEQTKWTLTVYFASADSQRHRSGEENWPKHGYASVVTGEEGFRLYGFEYTTANCFNLQPTDRVLGKWIKPKTSMSVVVPRVSGGTAEVCILDVKMGPGEGSYSVGKDGKATFNPSHHM